MTLIEILKHCESYLAKKGINRPRLEAEYLVGDALSLSRIDLYMRHDLPLTEKEKDLIRSWLERRGKREPLQYIKGDVSFFGAKIKVNRSVLIPRQETELLAERIAKEDLEGKTLLDLCTGSGCLGISLKKKNPSLSVTLSDISEDALEIAKENALLNEVSVEVLKGDLFSSLKARAFDYIVCNPPYVSKSEWETLEPEVKEFEPVLALIGGESGLDFYERLSKEAFNHLLPSGKLFLEIGSTQLEALKKMFSNGEFLSDYSGHDRFLIVSR